MGEGRDIQGFTGGNLREGDHLKDPGVDGRIILKRILEEWNGGAWTGSIWIWIGAVGVVL
jgi:hypothetical protein